MACMLIYLRDRGDQRGGEECFDSEIRDRNARALAQSPANS